MKRKPAKFIGSVSDDGRLTIRDLAGFRSLMLHHAGREVVLEVRRRTEDRTGKQNRYYWAVVVRAISEATGYSLDEAHDALRLKFLSVGSADLPSARSTAALSTVEFSRYVEDVREWAAVDLGLYIPTPEVDCEYP